jgi:hypothetical protein
MVTFNQAKIPEGERLLQTLSTETSLTVELAFWTNYERADLMQFHILFKELGVFGPTRITLLVQQALKKMRSLSLKLDDIYLAEPSDPLVVTLKLQMKGLKKQVLPIVTQPILDGPSVYIYPSHR